MDETKEYVIRSIKTCDKHYWVISESQDNKSNLLSINCNKCPIGANINPDKFKVKNGEIYGV